MRIKDIAIAALFVIASEAAGLIGSIFTFSEIPTWYAGLNKPFFTPPNWLFGPVWTTLYALMGIAAYLVWKKGWKKKRVKIALFIFAFQLILNTAWSILFFGVKNLELAFIEIIALWCAIVWNIVAFGVVRKLAALLLIPYLLWVSYASLLNLAIAILN